MQRINSISRNIALIFGGGQGTRVNGTGVPKQFVEICGKPVIMHTIEKYQSNENIDLIYIVCISDRIDYIKDYLKKHTDGNKIAGIFPGSRTAMHSIYEGLKNISKVNNKDDLILIHDAVRPLISSKTIDEVINVARTKGNAVACSPCEETVIITDNNREMISEVTTRKNMLVARAPQAFFLGDIISGFDKIYEVNSEFKDIVDSCTVYQKLDRKIYIAESNRLNIKITAPEDLLFFEMILSKGICDE